MPNLNFPNTYWASCRYNKSIKFVEKLASICLESSGTAYKWKHHKWHIFVGHRSYAHWLCPLCIICMQSDQVLCAHVCGCKVNTGWSVLFSFYYSIYQRACMSSASCDGQYYCMQSMLWLTHAYHACTHMRLSMTWKYTCMFTDVLFMYV